MKFTASHLVRAVRQLPKDRTYHYINPKNLGQIQIVDIVEPEGPIRIRRSTRERTLSNSPVESISPQMIWRVANNIVPNHPVNFDRILGASYNTRSVLETLLAHTTEFYFCKPGRIQTINSSTEIKQGHKHVLWKPDEPHEVGILLEKQSEIVISELPVEVVYDAVGIPDIQPAPGESPDAARRHLQMQIALILIGCQLGFRTWVARNDQGLKYGTKKIAEMNGVIASLESEKLLSAYSEAIRAALLIDCIWFRNSKFMPAVIEVEHSTGVVTGLSRMKNLQDNIPLFPTRWTIVAPDEDRDKVLRECNKEQFRSLDAQFFPYSAVEELFSLCQRRKLKGVNDDFLDCFMEPTIGVA